MKKVFISLVILVLIGILIKFRKNIHIKDWINGETKPVALKNDIKVTHFKKLNHLPIRIVYDSVSNIFYTCNMDGWVYKIPVIDTIPQDEIPLLAPEEHHINFLQGMLFHQNTLFLVGNHNNTENSNGYGLVEKCELLPDGSHKWSTLLSTETYPSSGTLFDHGFSGICLSVNKDSLYIASGSRTDHGEVKNSGEFKGFRDVPLTARIFRIPVNANTIYLPNDEAKLEASGYIFASGIRNEFDMALNSEKRLFGVENSGDRDDPDELNWLRQNHHYGFPWRMGGNENPMQYKPYDARKDKLIPAKSFKRDIFFNDPDYPKRPENITFTEPIKNIGPDANWIRNPDSGKMYQSKEINTFTGHRSPVGLVFDVDSTMQMPYTGSGFTLAYSPDEGNGYLPEEDSAGDLCQLILQYEETRQNYQVSVIRLVKGFQRLSDAEKVKNDIYVTDLFGNIWKITFPAKKSNSKK
ncbi:PQQ-dependent sugar dehydrogenase [Emticicia sp. BO119]|uniref:PQQ-dependent sugar dehydrogenase n=1 Tax=Emticicia sp. BO119 TaxID=2757768 RepID=UPI0015F0F378|nr:PQQ-dependent sugar dehydrogenase [Emticicia sp. BO119]MBA4849063.1 PQQ-dependent sugar dehydrogenase [Emticicia sp. BO119]